jgi:hypothetical protein
MSLVRVVENNILGLWSAIRAGQAEIRRAVRDIRDIKLTRDRGAGLLPGVPDYGPLSPAHQVVLLALTEFISGIRWKARRLTLGGVGYEADDEDTEEYIVEASPGCVGMFPGARGRAVFERVEVGQPGQPDIAIYEMFAGEAIGFQAQITGAPSDGAGTDLLYPWRQVGLAAADQYDDLTVIDPPGFTLGKALLLSSRFYDSQITDRQAITTGTTVWMWYDANNLKFLFDLFIEPVYVSECPF